jgi:hypothetical protein
MSGKKEAAAGTKLQPQYFGYYVYQGPTKTPDTNKNGELSFQARSRFTLGS